MTDLEANLPELPFSRKGTSEEAALSMRSKAATDRSRVTELAHQRGLRGLTCDEGEAILHISHQNMSARLNELESTKQTKRIEKLRATVPRQLFVVDKSVSSRPITRLTRSGRPALVYFSLTGVTLAEVLNHY